MARSSSGVVDVILIVVLLALGFMFWKAYMAGKWPALPQHDPLTNPDPFDPGATWGPLGPILRGSTPWGDF